MGTYLTQTNFSVSAAVGFISIFGVAIMDGLLLGFLVPPPAAARQIDARRHHRRKHVAHAVDHDDRLHGDLRAAAGGALHAHRRQAQRPLAIVVIGGMLLALFLLRYLTPVLYSLFRHRPPDADGAGLAE